MFLRFPVRSSWIASALAVLLASSSVVAHAQRPPEPAFPAGIRLAARERGEAAITALGNRLPEVAAFYGKTPQQLRALFRADRSLHADSKGQLFYACELVPADIASGDPAAADVIAESIGPTDPSPFDTSQAFLLHSRPGANRVIYLDFNGHIDNTPGNWTEGAYAPPFDVDGDETTFNATELNRIIGVWQRVAEDFAMYDINVTTEDPGIEALRKTNSSDAVYGIRVCIGGSSSDWYSGGAGGVAFVGSFDSSNDVPCWVFPKSLGNSEKNIAEAASHEVGHSLGLSHDGIEGGTGYYSGHGNWAPIMGVSYSKPISQWSKGEYANPNNPQDDLAVMLTQGAVYRPDDHGGAVATATRLSSDASGITVSGVIERTTDLDFFRVDAVGGSLAISATPAPRGGNLRVEVKLYDAAGTLLQTATSADTSAGTQPVTLTRTVSAGVFYFSVDGIGNGDPLTTGYSDYASLGQYNASVTGAVPGGFTWTSVIGGAKQWSTTGNWASAIVPNASGLAVRVNNDITGNQTIELTSATTLGSLYLGDINNTHAFTLASGTGSLVFNNAGIAANLSKTNGANDVISAPVSLVDNLVLTQSASGTLAFSGGISGVGALTKTGAGTLVFASPNSYTGVTTLEDGLLRLDNAAGLPGGIDNTSGAGESTLSFNGGVLGLASGDFTRQLGTGAGQLNWDPDTGGTGSGGFAAFGADREVRLNNGTSTLSWATAILGNGKTLILSHPTATHTLNFRNGISFSTQTRTLQVEDGAAAVDAILSGTLIGSAGTTAGLNKAGPGVLSLTNANTYPGSTTVADGVLRLQNASALPSGNLVLSGGGVLGLGDGDLTARTIGTGLNQVQWLGSGGFAAFGANRAVRFSTPSINWNATNFIGTGRVLVLGHGAADATLDWQQPISLAGNLRVIQVDDGSAAIDAKMSGVVAGGSSGTSNALTKTGAGTLAFTAQNTYWGNTTVGAGTLMIGDGGTTGGVSQNSASIIVEAGALLAANRSNTLTQGANAFKVAVTGDGGFTQAGTGNTVLMLANTYLGPTTLNAGTLTLGAAGVLPDTSAVFIGDATLAAGSFAETAGTLEVTGSATLSLGAGATLAFADSGALDWSGGLLDITGSFVSGSSIRFGVNSAGLTPLELVRISINGQAQQLALDGLGYLISGYSAWKAANAPVTGNNPEADEDGDGVPNALEFILGGRLDTKDQEKLPLATINGGNLEFTFKRDQKSIGGISALRVETSPDLADWTTGFAIPDGASAASPGVTVVKGVPAGFDTVSLSVPMSGSKLFVRLKVTP
jgi:autotransporter-associated beta strand protein